MYVQSMILSIVAVIFAIILATSVYAGDSYAPPGNLNIAFISQENRTSKRCRSGSDSAVVKRRNNIIKKEIRKRHGSDEYPKSASGAVQGPTPKPPVDDADNATRSKKGGGGGG
ncbi:hypothetical protein H4219_006083 [Mycoemilia scoparia]|uniref:Uncharacterized protein n=1 Tax=Mycoemilia scoparia TaxID=417184 RepID=A0A9W7ZLQ8_9FUNG|nr:hypothetical protein H4219_006083 [Mycoemilia scoparia]